MLTLKLSRIRQSLGDGRIEVAGVFANGSHTVTLVAESDGGTTEHQWMFEIVPDMTPPCCFRSRSDWQDRRC